MLKERSPNILDKEQILEQALDTVADREIAFESACVEFAEAESTYRIRFAKEFLNAEGTEKARHSTAIVAVEKQLRERDRTEAIKEFTFQKLKDAQMAVSARQSLLNADIRTNKAFA
jgi:hypothetical protein